MEIDRKIYIEVAFASSMHQKIMEMEVPVNTTARKAVEESGLDRIFPDFDFEICTNWCIWESSSR